MNNPKLFKVLYPDAAACKESTRPYYSEIVEEVLEKLGDFEYNNE